MDTLPPELHAYICQAICLDEGVSIRALSEVSKYFHEVSRPYLYHATSAVGTRQILALVDRLENTPAYLRHIYHLFLSDVPHSPSSPAAEQVHLTSAQCNAIIRLFTLAAPTLRTFTFHGGSPFTSTFMIGRIFRTSFPHLHTLVVSGFYPFPSVPGTFPSLTHLHLDGNRNPQGLLQVSALHEACPELAELKVTGLGGAAGFVLELTEALTEREVATGNQGVKDPIQLPPRLRRVTIQPGPEPSGCSAIATLKDNTMMLTMDIAKALLPQGVEFIMPKAKAQKSKTVVTKAPRSKNVPQPKAEDVETELTTSGTPFQPIHALHFDELNRIWPNDRRIPSAESRRAWALARNLNPVNVHSWWYRRRKIAKKSKFSIPRDTYELEIGTPPELPVVVKEEVAAADLLASELTGDDGIAASSDDSAMLSGTTGGIFTSDADSRLSECTASSLTLFSDVLDSQAPLASAKDAYMHSSPSKVDLYFEDPFKLSSDVPSSSRWSSLPPSSPPLQSLPSSRVSSPMDEYLETSKHLKLVLDTAPTTKPLSETGFVSDRGILKDALWASFSLLESFYPAEFLPTRMDGVPVSCCAYTPVLGLKSDREERALFAQPVDDRSPLDSLVGDFAPWCMDGFRIGYDGSLLGQCSYCSATPPSSANDE
ncbi:hypothetical protein CVT26_005528 [Gymnopilus dilepis]|uniref:Homeobox domain-containing protein n=1 Tax=Gymnopilus dilepis TaxID=231916 RepID=A0A409W7Z3_9AGAR|nr:hypothetical protein CVT26_005528 [Gymnopilus dilepis]